MFPNNHNFLYNFRSRLSMSRDKRSPIRGRRDSEDRLEVYEQTPALLAAADSNLYHVEAQWLS